MLISKKLTNTWWWWWWKQGWQRATGWVSLPASFSIFWIFDSQLSKILYSFLTLYNVVPLPVHFSCPCGHPLPGATLRSPFESWEDKQLCGGGWIQGHLWRSACKSKYLKLENPIFHQNAKVVTLPHIQPRDLQQQGMGRDQPFVLHPQRKPEVQPRFKKIPPETMICIVHTWVLSVLLLLTERWRSESPWVVRGSITATSWWMLFLSKKYVKMSMKIRTLFSMIRRLMLKTRINIVLPRYESE